jgi:predicted RNA-binding protein with PUA-like domain
MNCWLLKTEPGCYGIDDLQRDKTTSWGGIRNYQARNMLRDQMQKGDLCIFYHSNAEPPCAAGVCIVAKAGYPDPTQFDPRDDHYDETSTKEEPRWFAVDVSFKQKFKQIVPLETMRRVAALKNMELLRKGSRLSVMPLTKSELDEIVRLAV